MALLPILEYPDPRLKKVATPVAAVTPEVRKLVRDMAETMYAAPGVGSRGGSRASTPGNDSARSRDCVLPLVGLAAR